MNCIECYELDLIISYFPVCVFPEILMS